MTGRTGNTWLRALAALACAGLLMAAAVDSGIAKAKAPPAPASATSGDDGDMPQDAGSGDDTGGDDMDGPGSDEPVDAGAEGGGASQIDKSGGPDVPIDVKAPPVAIRLSAHLTEKGPELAKGLTWRIFDPAPKADGKLKLVGETKGGSVSLMLRPGTYFVHVAYGRAGATRKITAGRDFSSDLILNAGGMRLMAMVGKDQPLSAGDVTFSIYAPEEDGAEERAVVVANAPAGRIIGLNAGTYHVVCKYGYANAIVRADIH
ncbi:MAG: hypothetical protein J0H63_03385, partial [Rhizobiales bacterium]|nr:hypothetical protein [Hyphomicrobiales bacterium]